MLRLKKHHADPTEEYLALPGAEPVTLVEIPGDNLDYACQCPLCGGIFNIPEGVLYKIEEDDIEDVDSGAEPSDMDFEEAPQEPSSNPMAEAPESQAEEVTE